MDESAGTEVEMTVAKREIGPVGTAARVLIGVGLLQGAGGAGGLSWGGLWYDPLVAAVALPAVAVAFGLAAHRYAEGAVRLTGPFGIALNLALIAALVSNPYTGGGATLFYGATMLVAAWRGQPGCEATVVSNLILNRDDQIGCPTLTPIDAAEAYLGEAARSKLVWGHSLAAATVCVATAAALALVAIFGQTG